LEEEVPTVISKMVIEEAKNRGGYVTLGKQRFISMERKEKDAHGMRVREKATAKKSNKVKNGGGGGRGAPGSCIGYATVGKNGDPNTGEGHRCKNPAKGWRSEGFQRDERIEDPIHTR